MRRGRSRSSSSTTSTVSPTEIFSHAIKTLQRGKLVGVPTARGVISTVTQIMGAGFLRLPNRGWFLRDGQIVEDGRTP